ncbi:MAG TPA: right-handed parallel beta-helix repeat-containing protein [Myxococcales bacterium]|jgi:hypothetical protein
MKRSIALAIAVLALGGCRKNIVGVTCDGDKDCPGGRCLNGICTDAADASTPPDAAEPDAGPECLNNDDCLKCERCSDGACVFQTGTEDLKNECDGDCETGNCDGAGGCGLKPKDTECRAAAGDCDVAAVCTGDAPDCPANEFKPSTKICREAPGACDVPEFCTGASADCPTNAYKSATTPCRPAKDNCDRAENCTGDSADCPTDAFQPEGTECEAESCTVSTYSAPRTCDDKGVCKAVVTKECAPYVCGPTKCNETCAGDADCTTQLCDIRSSKCATSVENVNCSGTPGALQTAIDGCAATSPCFLRASGTCEKILVQNKDIFIAGTFGASIDPTSDGPAVSVREDNSSQVQTTRLALVRMTIRGASGASGHGVECSGLGGGIPELALSNSVIGGPGVGESNAGNGISASNSTLSVSSSIIQNNSAAGISASSSTLSVSSSIIQNNSKAGISATESGFSIENTIIARNGLVDGSAGVALYSTTDGLAKIFRFNTVASNLGGGITCAGTKGDTTIVGSLFWNPGATEITEPRCIADATSDIPNFRDACGNGKDTEPKFVDLALPGTDFHLQSDSDCIDKIACIPEVTKDVDGRVRPQRNSCDVGAHEVP